MANPTAHECFVAAFQLLRKERGRGVQARLAEYLGKDPPYINDLVQGRRNFSQQLQEQVSSFFGYRLEEMISMGRRILEGIDPASYLPFQDELDKLPEFSFERYMFIYEKAANSFGFSEVHTMLEPMIGAVPQELEAYKRGEISDAELYEFAKKMFAGIAKNIRGGFERWKKRK